MALAEQLDAPQAWRAPREGATAAAARDPLTDGQRMACATLFLFILVCFAAFGWKGVLAGLHLTLFAAFMAPPLIRLFAALAPAPEADPPLAPRTPLYTIIAPLFREAGIAAQLIRNLAALDYPPGRLQILLALEAGDTETIDAVRQANPPSHFEIVLTPPGSPKTKPRACNYALQLARGEFLVIYDAEDRPHPDQLGAAVAAFDAGPPDLACVQAPLRMRARGDFLSRQFELEYALQFGVILPALVRLGLPYPLGGTSNHFRGVM